MTDGMLAREALERKEVYRFIQGDFTLASRCAKKLSVMLYGHIPNWPNWPNWPDEQLQPLLEKFEELLLEQRVFRNVFGVIQDMNIQDMKMRRYLSVKEKMK